MSISIATNLVCEVGNHSATGGCESRFLLEGVDAVAAAARNCSARNTKRPVNLTSLFCCLCGFRKLTPMWESCYLPVVTNFTHWPWFLKGAPAPLTTNFQPSFLHCSLSAGVLKTSTRLLLSIANGANSCRKK